MPSSPARMHPCMYIFLLWRPDGLSVLGHFSLEFPALGVEWLEEGHGIREGTSFRGRDEQLPFDVCGRLVWLLGNLFLGVSLSHAN